MRSVLVVDDNPSIRNLLAEELRYRGYSVIVAGNGSEALDCLHVTTPDAIVLDLMMPVMDGWSFVEHYRDQAGSRTVPIIAVSAEGDLAPGYEALGVTAFLRKPFDLNELANCIAQLTGAGEANHAHLLPSLHRELVLTRSDSLDPQARLPGGVKAQDPPTVQQAVQGC